MQWNMKKWSQMLRLHIFLAESTNVDVENFYRDYQVISRFYIL